MTPRLLLPAVICLAVFPTPVRAGDKAVPFQTDVWVSGQGGYHTYRIPALLVTTKGTLLAFCEGRKTGSGDHGDLDLLVKRSEDRGSTWGAQQLVYEEGGDKKITIGNPCPVVDRDTGTIWLPFTRDNHDVLLTKSDDDGRTWAKPVVITVAVKKSDWGWYATGPGVGLQLERGPHRGRLVIPCDHRDKKTGVTYSHVFYSDDHGKTWELGGTVAPHTNECQAVELPGGVVQINMRNYWGRDGKEKDKGSRRAVAVSDDGGKTWGELRFDAALVEPVCQASLTRFRWPDDGRKSTLLFSNPAHPSKRVNLTVRASFDEGQTWPVAKTIQAGPAAYSCLAVLPDGSIGCLYEGGATTYQKLRFARFPLVWLTE